MRKTIVIPTDFSIQSLTLLKSLLSTNASKAPLDIILLHGIHSTDSIRDLLFFSKSKQIELLSNPEFEEAFEVIRNKFDAQIHSLRIDLFTGHNLRAFKKYLEANGVVKIIVTQTKQQLNPKHSVDLTPWIAKCGLEVETLAITLEGNAHEKGAVSEVFNQISMI